MFKRILLAYDGSDHTLAALRQSADLARLCNAELHLLGIVVTTGSAAMAQAYLPDNFFGMERAAIEKALSEGIWRVGAVADIRLR